MLSDELLENIFAFVRSLKVNENDSFNFPEQITW